MTSVSRLPLIIAVVCLASSVVVGCSSSPGDGVGGGGISGRGGAPGSGGAGTGGGGSGGGGTGGGAGGGSGQCGTQPPAGAPFNCRATYDEQSQANCAVGGVNVMATSGLCERFQQAKISYGFYTVTCSYESGALVWAQRCDDFQAWCGNFCTVSTGAPTPPLSCALTPQCTRDAAAD